MAAFFLSNGVAALLMPTRLVSVPVAHPVAEPLARLLQADARRLQDQLDCEEECQISCLAHYTQSRLGIVHWAASRSLTTAQRHLADAAEWLQVLPALAIAGWLAPDEHVVRGPSFFEQLGHSFAQASARSAAWLRSFWPRRPPQYVPRYRAAVHFQPPRLATAIKPLHPEILKVAALGLRTSPLVVLGLGFRRGS